MSDGTTLREVYKCTLCRKYVEKHEIVKIHKSSNCRVPNPFELYCAKCFARLPGSIRTVQD